MSSARRGGPGILNIRVAGGRPVRITGRRSCWRKPARFLPWEVNVPESFLISLVFGQFLVEDFAANIGPEFSQFVGHAIPHHEHSQCPYVSRESAIFRRVVEIGDAGRRRVAAEFGVVEPRMARVRAGHEETGKGTT